jgi:hypothetical protein
MSIYFILQFVFFALAMLCLFGIFIPKKAGARLAAAIGFSFFAILTISSSEKMKQLKQEEKMEMEEKNFHNNFLNLIEGRYVLDSLVSVDSTKVQFILQLPGIAERKVEMIAYDNSPTYWNEWQAEGAQLGDTLLVADIWNADSTYSRNIQKMDASQIGLGYISNEWLIDHSYEEPPRK